MTFDWKLFEKIYAKRRIIFCIANFFYKPYFVTYTQIHTGCRVSILDDKFKEGSSGALKLLVLNSRTFSLQKNNFAPKKIVQVIK